ncbi:MAG: hypothetical protein AB1918_19325 [Pseudomonadota bacterium]
MTKKPHTHTPGPWTIDHDSLVMGGQVVAHAADLSTDSSSYEEGVANLRLIAAAPELLDLLSRLYDHVAAAEGKMRAERKTLQADLGYGTLGEISDAVDAVLAKARGRA